MKNLFGMPEHRALQEEMHTLTLEWMERFGIPSWMGEN